MQSALLEVMQERQVTLGHTTHPVPDPFLVMATQNPIESEGTYPLPEAQVDRFMLKILVDYPLHDEELTVIQRSLVPPPELTQLLSIDDLRAVQAAVRGIYVDPGLVSYALQLATATRRPDEFGLPELARFISFGASPRGPISLIHAARGLAVDPRARLRARPGPAGARSRTRSATGSCSRTRRSPSSEAPTACSTRSSPPSPSRSSTSRGEAA